MQPPSSPTSSFCRPAAGRRARRPRLAAIGDLVLDIVVRAAADVSTGSDVPGSITFRAGGSAANTCRAWSSLGGDAAFIGAVGRDSLAERLTAVLRDERVRVHVVRVPAPTARLAVLVADGGERSFVTQRGAADLLSPEALRSAWLRRIDVLHLPAYSLLAEPLASAALAAAREVHANGALVSFDLASRQPLVDRGARAVRRLISSVAPEILFGNRDEVAALAGAGGASTLLELAPVLVVKEGMDGCRVLWRPAQSRASADLLELTVATERLEATDTTGAGDAFDAGFMYALVEQSLAARARQRRRGIHSGTGASSAARFAHRRPDVLRRAAVAGHRAATRLLSRPRHVLDL